MLENSIAGTLESIETIEARASSCQTQSGSTGSVISGSSCRVGTLSLSRSPGDILILSSHVKIDICTN